MNSQQPQAPTKAPVRVWENEHGDGDECERLKEYGDGGLCPIIIDDELSGNDLYDQRSKHLFKIMGKLGYGAYATVWLARNMHVLPERSDTIILAVNILLRC